MASRSFGPIACTKKAEVGLRLCLLGYLSWAEHSLRKKKRQVANSAVQKPA
jgi:hypothetical protein